MLARVSLEPFIPILVSTDPSNTTATPNDGTYPDFVFDASTTARFNDSVGDTEYSFTFTVVGDTYDEGINDNTVTETIQFTLDAGNAENLRVDTDGTTAFNTITHTVHTG